MSAGMNTGRDINALHREKEAILLQMGKVMHKLVRDNSITSTSCTQLAERIAQIDAEICTYGEGRVPGQGEGVCPNCKATLAAATVSFCTSCGTNLNEFYSQNTAQCTKCGQLTASDGTYCTVCGVKRMT